MYSVVIPSLGRVKYLNELISSILAQTVQPLEILILLDDNSHCRSIEHEINLGELTKLVWCNHMNLAEKRNHGASLIQSNFLLFSDDDDIWHQERAELVIKALERSPVCCHNYGKFGSDSGDALNKLGNHDVNLTRYHLLFGANVFGGGSAMAVRKDIVELFPFTKSYSFCEDFQWWVRLIFAGIHIKYIGKPLVFYRTHSTNMTRALTRISYYSLMVSKEVFLRAIFMLLVSVLIALRATAKFALGWFFSIKK